MEIKIKTGSEVIKNFKDGYYKVTNTFYCIKDKNIYQIYLGDNYKNFVCDPTKFDIEPIKITGKEWLDAVTNILATIQLTLPHNIEIRPIYTLTAQEEKRLDDIAEQIREQDLHNENKD